VLAYVLLAGIRARGFLRQKQVWFRDWFWQKLWAMVIRTHSLGLSA